jgi:hypothetical protein
MRLALSSNSLPLRLTFLLGVFSSPGSPSIDSDTVRLLGIEKVPLDPSGNDMVCISNEDSAVVAFACHVGLLVDLGEAGRSVAWRRGGLGGRGGSCSSILLPPSDGSGPVPPSVFVVPPGRPEGSSPLSEVIGAAGPSSAVCALGVEGSVVADIGP